MQDLWEMGAYQLSMRERRRRGLVAEGGTKDGQGGDDSGQLCTVLRHFNRLVPSLPALENQLGRVDDFTCCKMDPFGLREIETNLDAHV